MIHGRAGNYVIGGGGGNDWLIGEQGNDLLVGGTGDRFVFTFDDGLDTVLDFTRANGAGDLMDLHGYSAVGVTDFASLQSHMS
jgi:Ca2+-binding RTX toxin-like protein